MKVTEAGDVNNLVLMGPVFSSTRQNKFSTFIVLKTGPFYCGVLQTSTINSCVHVHKSTAKFLW